MINNDQDVPDCADREMRQDSYMILHDTTPFAVKSWSSGDQYDTFCYYIVIIYIII